MHVLPLMASGCMFDVNARSTFYLAPAKVSTQCYSMDAILATTCRNAHVIWEETIKGENGDIRSCHSC